MRAVKIAFVSTMRGGPWGGSETLWSAAARGAAGAGHEVMAVTYRWSPPPSGLVDLENHGVAVADRGRAPSGHHKRMADLVESRLRGLRRFRPDVICISQGATYDILDSPRLLSFVSRAQVPYIVLCHLSIDGQRPQGRAASGAARFLSGAACVGFSSYRGLETTERQLALSLPAAQVLQNPLNLSDRSPLTFPSCPPAKLACVARLECQAKGQDLLLAALAGDEWKARTWRLRFYGEGPDRDYLTSLAAYYGLSDRTSFVGQVAEIRDVWSGNQVLVLPSRVEGTPLALLEAQVLGRPAVVTDVGDCASWVLDGQTGFVARAPTVASLRAALEEAWASRSEWPEFGRNAHAAAAARIGHDPAADLLGIIVRAATRGPEQGRAAASTQVAIRTSELDGPRS